MEEELADDFLSATGRRRIAGAAALAVGIWLASTVLAVAETGALPCEANGQRCWLGHKLHNHSRGTGFQGFGLGYHLGYGYGGAAVGVGPDGGYPLYGGPGYVHAEPRLRRCGGLAPFFNLGGPGSPAPPLPNVFGGVGPLAPEQPVVRIGGERTTPDYAHSYGGFHGVLPYPEAAFAPFTTAASGSADGTRPSSSSVPPTTVRPGSERVPAGLVASRVLGVEVEPVIDDEGQLRLRIGKVIPDSVAQTSGLEPGDVIQSINGYRTEEAGHLTWIIADAVPQNVLKITVRRGATARFRRSRRKSPDRLLMGLAALSRAGLPSIGVPRGTLRRGAPSG